MTRDENNSNNVHLNNIPLPTFTQGVEFTATTTTVTDAPCSSIALVQDSGALGTGIFEIQEHFSKIFKKLNHNCLY